MATRANPDDRRPDDARLRRVSVVVCLGALLPGCSDFGLFKNTDPVDEPVLVEEVFDQAPLPQVDVLWVVDDTGSMEDEQQALTDAFDAFIDAVDALELDWQTGVITADSDGDDAGVLLGNPWIIHPDLDDPVGAFTEAVDVGTDGGGAEAGLGAAWLALSEPLVDGDNRGFRRPQAALHVVIVSDADDDSTAVLGDDPATAFLDFLDTQAAASGTSAALSAVVGPTPDGCGSAQPAEVYSAVAEQSGGAVQSICEADFSAVTTAIGEASITWPDTFVLQACPASGTVSVRVDELRQDEDQDYTVDTDPCAVVFVDPPPAGARIEVSYELPEDGA